MAVANLLNAVSANTTGPVAGLGTPYGNLTLAVSTSGTVSAFSVVLQGSLDGFNFEAIGSAITSATAGTSMGTGILFQYFQAVLSGYSGTGTVTAVLAYSLNSSASGGGGPPSGNAGGVLSGTYPSPGLAASPALTGTPTAPTATALTDSTQVATTAYTDSAVAVETSRAETAEALKLAKAGNLSDVASAATALANLSGAAQGASLGGLTSTGLGVAIQTMPVATLTTEVNSTAQFLYASLCTADITTTINHLGCYVQRAGITTGTGVNGLGIYSATGSQLAVTGDMTSAFASTGNQEGTLGSGVAITAGTNYYLVYLHNYTGTTPNLAGMSVQSLSAAIRSLYPLGTVSSQASFPPSITPSSMGASANRNWIYGR